MSWVGRDVLRRSCCDASAGADADADADAGDLEECGVR